MMVANVDEQIRIGISMPGDPYEQPTFLKSHSTLR